MFFTDELRERVFVEGCGISGINGMYQRISTEDNAGKYIGPMSSFSEYSLHLRAVSGGKKQWCITKTIGNQIADFTAPQSADDPDYPPAKGWKQMGASSSSSSSRAFGTSSFGNPPYTTAPPTLTVLSVRMPSLLPLVSVVKPVATTYEKLLFKEEFADVQFICGDAVVVPAHRCILAAASTYFRAACGGPWKENQSGVLNTSHPSHIIKAMLEAIYTGVASDLIMEAPLEFISVAEEFDLDWLKKLVEPHCVRSLDASNLKLVWQTGRLYENDLLKKACIKYAKKNPTQVLTTSDITDLRNDDSASWEEFANAVGETTK